MKAVSYVYSSQCVSVPDHRFEMGGCEHLLPAETVYHRHLKHDASRLKAFEDTSKVFTKCAVVLHFTETSPGNDKTHVASTVGNTKACHVPLPVP